MEKEVYFSLVMAEVGGEGENPGSWSPAGLALGVTQPNASSTFG